MPSRDDTGSPAAGHDAGEQEQDRLSRRSVLRGAAGAGAAGIAAAAFSGVAAPAMAASAKPAGHGESGAAPRAGEAEAAEQIVVHVRDARSGEIDVFRGTSQTSVRDRELAARLVRASRQ